MKKDLIEFFLRDNLLKKIKDGTYLINFDECARRRHTLDCFIL